LAIIAAAAALLAGCGSDHGLDATARTGAENSARPATDVSPNPRSLWITLDARAGAENVGVLTAQLLRYFEARGLHVEAGSPANVAAPVLYVADKTAVLGISQLPQVVMARAEGEPVVAVGSLLPQPTAAMIWLRRSGIRDIADLRGHTIAIPGVPFQRAFLMAVLGRAGLTPKDVEVREVGYNLVPALIRGRADAIFGGSQNLEGAQLESRGLAPVVTPVRDLGVPPYDEIVVVARTTELAGRPRMIRHFLAATAHGTATGVGDPDVAEKAIEKSFERDPTLDGRTLAAQVKATLPLLSTTGHINPARAARLVAWMHEQGMVKREIPVSKLLTNRFAQTNP